MSDDFQAAAVKNIPPILFYFGAGFPQVNIFLFLIIFKNSLLPAVYIFNLAFQKPNSIRQMTGFKIKKHVDFS